ncbi:helix-turn-helix transcriptional regulator [Mycobacterium intracellulare]|uniref:Helix-turn-helix transcriptional regulator n=1 Tax=Mycobacterium intracellulare subsp. chimaera TaxID=222805 RepID=A0ABT7P8A1_MYCIT|nr:helix-turn-helix transcriptional regulator [Mycobacterium intracellulare]MDM3929291.1 helix-turn-helix transcriptional regulator [Mycobacterium intracellulare subsp. chimaera]
MVSIDDFSRVVSEIYASAVDPANWTVAMSEVSRVLDATGSGLIVGAGRHRSVMVATMPQEAVATYGQYYHAIDFILDACENGPTGLIRGGRELVAQKTHSEFYANWQRPFGLTDGLFVRLSTESTPASFVIAAPQRDERFDTTERLQFAGALIRHLEQALRTQHRLTELDRAATELTEVIDGVHHGVIIVAAAGKVLHMNSSAAQILTACDGLRIRSGAIEAKRTATNEQLHACIHRALIEQCDGGPSGECLACPRPSGKRPYVIHALPLTKHAAEPASAKALLIIIDPEQEPEPPKTLIRRLFGLTNAEADVAIRVINGEGLKPIAEDLALSRATVNTHLQRVFEKTGTHRQAELVRLLLAISPSSVSCMKSVLPTAHTKPESRPSSDRSGDCPSIG